MSNVLLFKLFALLKTTLQGEEFWSENKKLMDKKTEFLNTEQSSIVIAFRCVVDHSYTKRDHTGIVEGSTVELYCSNNY